MAVDTQEADLETEEAVKTWLSRITRGKLVHKDRFETKLKRQRGYVAGELHDDGSSGLVRTNLVFSTIATVLPHVYAKNPDISVSLTDAVPRSQYEAYKKFASTMERVLHNLLVDAGKLKRRMKAATRSTMTTGVGWIKVIFQSDITTDPYVQARMQDVQDNLRRIAYLNTEIDDPLAENREAKKLELQQQFDALAEKSEVRRVRGFVIDRVLTEDIMILDESVREFDYYTESDAIAHGVWYTADKYRETFGQDAPDTATKYRPDEAGMAFQADATATQDPGRPQVFHRVWEIWHIGSQSVYTVVEGGKKWCRPPFVPKRQGKRWYPFFCLGFNLIDGRWWPISDEDLLESLQDEYNTTRTNFAEHRKASIPVLVVRGGGELSPEDIERIRKRKINEIIVVEGTGAKPLQDDIAAFDPPKMDPQVYDTSPIRQDVDMVSGTSEAARSTITTPKTATEAQIMEAGLMSRTSERQDAIEDLIDDMANFAAEVALLELDPPEVVTIAGEDSVWPTLNQDQVWRLVKIKIKSGSTGKPNRAREQEQWVKLLPEIQETMKQVAELRLNGQYDMAQASIELLKETMQRFDEYIDLDRFIPRDEAGGPQQAMQQQMLQLTQQNQQLQEQSQQIQADLAQCQQELDAAKRAEQAKLAQVIADGHVNEAKVVSDRNAQAVKLANDKQVARDKLNNDFAIEQRRLDDAKALAELELAKAQQLEILKLASAERLERVRAGLKATEMAHQADQSEADATRQEGLDHAKLEAQKAAKAPTEADKSKADMSALSTQVKELAKTVASAKKPTGAKIKRDKSGKMESIEMQYS